MTEFSYSDNLLISSNTYLNDSLLKDKAFECYAFLDMKNGKQLWRKFPFYRTYEHLDEPTAMIFDTSELHLKLTDKFSIETISNWQEFFASYKRKVNLYTSSFNSQQQERIKPFIQNIALDSLLIIAKNVNDIQFYNQGLAYLFNSDLAIEGMKIENYQHFTKLSGTEQVKKENLNYTLKKLAETVETKMSKTRINRPIRSYLFEIDNAKKKIQYAEQTISIVYGRDTVIHELKIFQTAQDLSKWKVIK